MFSIGGVEQVARALLMANPVKEAPGVVRSTVAALCVALFILDIFHAEIVPFRLAKMKKGGSAGYAERHPRISDDAGRSAGYAPSRNGRVKFVPGVLPRFAGAMVELPVTAYRLDVAGDLVVDPKGRRSRNGGKAPRVLQISGRLLWRGRRCLRPGRSAS